MDIASTMGTMTALAASFMSDSKGALPQMSRTRHFMITITAVTVAAGLLLVCAIYFIVHPNLYDILLALLFVVGIGIVVGVFFGWLAANFVDSMLQSHKPSVIASLTTDIDREMNVAFELTSNDVLSFYYYNYEQSPTLGKARKLIRRALLFSVAVELLAAAILLVVFGRDYLSFVVVLGLFAVLTLLYYFFAPLLGRKSIKGLVARDYGHGKDKLTGKNKLTITPDAVTNVTEMGKSTTRWDAIEWIASTDQYLFMTVRGSGPFIVPKRAFTDEQEFKKFIDTAKTYHQAVETSNRS